ncbi:hypothetical protein GCM10020219_076200 [Nonomuraea dietziae]
MVLVRSVEHSRRRRAGPIGREHLHVTSSSSEDGPSLVETRSVIACSTRVSESRPLSIIVSRAGGWLCPTAYSPKA